MSLSPTPPKPQDQQQGQTIQSQTNSRVNNMPKVPGTNASSTTYVYDKNDTSPISLSYSAISFGNPKGIRSGYIGWAVGAFFAVGGIWNFLHLADKGTIGAGILLCVIGVFFIWGGSFINSYSISADASGFHFRSGKKTHDLPWPTSRSSLYARVKLGASRTTRLTSNTVELTLVSEDGQTISIQPVSFIGPNINDMEAQCVAQATRLWNWAVSKGYTHESGNQVRIEGLGIQQAMRSNQQDRFDITDE